MSFFISAVPIVAVLSQRRILITFFLGIASGLPFAATGSILQARLSDAGMDVTTIGLISLVGLPYTVKFLWAPLLDCYSLPFLGRRRGWILLSQILLLVVLPFLGLIDPVSALPTFVGCAALAAFLSATQDIVVDAHRRDTLSDSELGIGSGLFIAGYRVAMITVGAGGVALAQFIPWNLVYVATACFMAVAALFTLFATEEVSQDVPTTIRAAISEPIADFLARPKIWHILLLVILYRLGDSMAASVSTVFFLQTGFSKVEVAAVANGVGVFLTIFGGIIGGVIGLRVGVYRSLWICGVIQAVSTLGYAVLALFPGKNLIFVGAVSLESLTNGMGIAAYAGFLLSLCTRKYSATQYALLSSLMGFSRVVFGSSSGWLADHFGWAFFFVICTALAIPGLLLIANFQKRSGYTAQR